MMAAVKRPLFLIVSWDREGEDEHDDHDGEEGGGDEGDHKSCNESTASLQIILEDIRQLVTVTLFINLTLVLDTLTAQPEIILQSHSILHIRSKDLSIPFEKGGKVWIDIIRD